MSDEDARALVIAAWSAGEGTTTPLDPARATALVKVVINAWLAGQAAAEYSQWCESMGDDL